MGYKFYAQRVFSFRWDESVAFYRDQVGLPLKFQDADMGWAEFDLEGLSLAIERQDPKDPVAQSLVGRFVGISIEVDNIDSVYHDLCDKGVKFTGPPAKQPWGGVLAHMLDPDNNVVTLLGNSDS